MVDKLGFRPDRVDVVPPGIDPRFQPGGERSAEPLVVAVGRLVPVKHFDELIRTMHEVRREVPDARLTVVGEGFERPQLDDLVHQLDAEDWVTFAGRIDDDALVELYRRAWVVASASSHEGWGMTITEAAACGTPAVATRISGHLDAIDEGTSGLLADDQRQLAAHLVAVLSDGELRERLAEGARRRAARLTWETTAYETLRVLAEDARRRGHTR
jgi:glycosyltransferase involved in cell wall biosynthesis